MSVLAGMVAVAAGLHGAARSSGNGWAGQSASLNDLGEPASVDLPARCAGFDVRRGGAWTHPGAQAFRGDPYCAILATGIPEPHAGRLAEDIRRGDAVGTVEISAAGIHGAGLQFADRVDMSYGNGMSLGQRVGFALPRTERGLLFQRAGYWIAVPKVCGNITRLYGRLSEGPQATMAPPPDDPIGDPPAGFAVPHSTGPLPVGHAAPKRLGASSQIGGPGPAWPGAPGPFGSSGSPGPMATSLAWAASAPPALPVAGPAFTAPPIQLAPQAADPVRVPDRSTLDPLADLQGTGIGPLGPKPTPVPEPDSLLCMLAGGVALAGSLARRRRGGRPK